MHVKYDIRTYAHRTGNKWQTLYLKLQTKTIVLLEKHAFF